MDIIVEAGDPRTNAKVSMLLRKFIKRVASPSRIIAFLKTLWKLVGSISHLNVVIEIQPIDLAEPKRFVGGILKAAKWVRGMDKLHRRKFGGSTKSDLDLRWKIIALSNRTENELKTLYNASPMQDPRAVLLQWRNLHRQNRDDEYRGRPGRRQYARAARLRRIIGGGSYMPPERRRSSTTYVPDTGDIGDMEYDYEGEGDEFGYENKEKGVDMETLNENARKAILRLQGVSEPIYSINAFAESKDFEVFYAKMKKGNPKLSVSAAKKLYKQFLKKKKATERLSTFSDMIETALTTKKRKGLPDSAFAYVDTKTGKRHYPVHDKAHVLAAIAYAKKNKNAIAKKAWPAIKKAAKKFGIEAGSL